MRFTWHWLGKTSQGVNRWAVRGDMPTHRLGLILLGYGVLAGCASLGFLLHALLSHSWQYSGAILIFLGHALFPGSMGAIILHILRLSNQKQVGKFLGVSEVKV